MQHETYMIEALTLAARGMSLVAPNPLVGAIIVKNRSIVGRGYHVAYGKEHAEVAAIHDAGSRARGATMYVNLEPCCTQWEGKHHPPCVDAIMQAGIKKVVIAHRDPNPQIMGKGITALQVQGIQVETGICKQAALELNQAYITNIRNKEIFVQIKFAMSLDGKIGLMNGESKWISGIAARTEVHRLRAMHTAVMVGAGTVVQDNPYLTVRHVAGQNPLRVILDKRFLIPTESHVIQEAKDGKSLICISEQAAAQHAERMKVCQDLGVEFLVLPEDQDGSLGYFIRAALESLFKMGVYSVLIEGGAKTLNACLSQKIWHKMTVFISPMIIGHGISPFQNLSQHHVAMQDIERYPAQWTSYDDGMKVEWYNPTCLVDL